MAYMNPLALALGNSLGPDAPPEPPKMGRGQLIAGILADALAGAMGKPGQFAQQMGEQRQQDREQAQWGLRRRGQLEDWVTQEQWKQAHPDPSPMVRDAEAWQTMTPEQRANYQAVKQAGAGDPDVFVTLPNGQVYAGPKSGLTQALTGGGAPQRPVGNLTPIGGGPTPPASDGFPRYR